MGMGQYVRLQRLCDIRAGSRLVGRDTALIWAADKGHTDITAALIFAGADVDVLNNVGYGQLRRGCIWVRSRERSSALHPGRQTAEAVSEVTGKSAQYVEAVRKVRRVEHSRSALGLRRPLPAGGGWGTLNVGLTRGLRSRCGHCSVPFGIGAF